MKQKLFSLSESSKLRWLLLAAIAVTNIYAVTNPGLGLIVFLLPITFALLHSLVMFGRRHTIVLFAIIMIVSFAAEWLGVHTGEVFGHYYYNTSGQINGFLVGGVPPLVTFSYVSMGYVCYMLARIIMGQYSKLRGWNLLAVPVIAALFMTMWDLCFDPIASYVQQRYIWTTGGVYHGVPFRNFTGWFLNTFVIFMLMSLYLNAFAKAKDYLAKPSRLLLAEVIVALAVNAFAIVAKGSFIAHTPLQEAMALMALFGLGMPIAIASFRLLAGKTR